MLLADAVEVAPRLLNQVLVAGDRAGRIVETEAYGGAEDPASHAFGGPTRRNASMFAPAGTLYAYRSYGIHTCANVSVGASGVGAAVLVRAVEPLTGLDAMRLDRPAARSDRDLANGPGKLCAALGISLEDDGVDLCDPAGHVRLCSDGVAAPEHPRVTARVGISRALDRPWRFVVPGTTFASGKRASASGSEARGRQAR